MGVEESEWVSEWVVVCTFRWPGSEVSAPPSRCVNYGLPLPRKNAATILVEQRATRYFAVIGFGDDRVGSLGRDARREHHAGIVELWATAFLRDKHELSVYH